MIVRIKVTQAPTTPWPPWVQQAWVGLKMPAEPCCEVPGQVSGYTVSGKDAYSALIAEGRTEAAKYWNGRIGPFTRIWFRTECCTVLEEAI